MLSYDTPCILIVSDKITNLLSNRSISNMKRWKPQKDMSLSSRWLISKTCSCCTSKGIGRRCYVFIFQKILSSYEKFTVAFSPWPSVRLLLTSVLLKSCLPSVAPGLAKWTWSRTTTEGKSVASGIHSFSVVDKIITV